MSFPFYKQHDTMDCGPTCLRMVAKYYGIEFPIDMLRSASHITREGVSIAGIKDAAESLGFETFAANATFEELDEISPLPCILHWNQNHYVVLPPQNYNRNKKNDKILVADPAHGLMKITQEAFLQCWMGDDEKGVVLLLDPTKDFYRNKNTIKERKASFSFFIKYFSPYKKYIFQLLLSTLIGSILSLVFPFLTQALVDNGINQKNMSFVYMVLISQLFLFTGNTVIDMIRNWIVLHMNTRVNIHMISDFLAKLMRLPINFFDTKIMGDVQQRIADHQRVQNFLTGTSLSTIFSLANLVVFSCVLMAYSYSIIGVFALFSVLSSVWVMFFMRKRKELDYSRFKRSSENQNMMFELISGMQEIKLNNCEDIKRQEWEMTQANSYKVSVQTMALEQYQQMGSFIFTQLKNIVISYITAREVISGNMTLGMMMSVSYIVGQLNGPIGQLLGLAQATQDAKLSLDRISEIHAKENEEIPGNQVMADNIPFFKSETFDHNIVLNRVSFQYGGPQSPFVLKDINLVIPKGKITAIVGSSGSGKTTLLKLLLKFYDPSSGEIRVGTTDITRISPRSWRSKCGTVMQDGYIFSDSVANNIAVSDSAADLDKVKRAAEVANIKEFIEELPLSYSTKIGNAGNGISMGQRQRMLIARAVYKDPPLLLFDEATSALDANNERIIMQNLEEFYESKTVVVIAHRLSTVMNADQIVVLEKGEIVEIGNHKTLTARKGNYFNLVRNQLELGS